ncbi:hypothetical protein MJT46_010921 [Ovis ammon polii x Ovis aries]|nr:hypothetical protein MJT46_010921 [Ovis ammon polii x Ovis aries]
MIRTSQMCEYLRKEENEARNDLDVFKEQKGDRVVDTRPHNYYLKPFVIWLNRSEALFQKLVPVYYICDLSIPLPEYRAFLGTHMDCGLCPERAGKRFLCQNCQTPSPRAVTPSTFLGLPESRCTPTPPPPAPDPTIKPSDPDSIEPKVVKTLKASAEFQIIRNETTSSSTGPF